MRKVLVVTATTSVGMALLACSGPRPSAVDSATTSPVIYERSARVARAPLSPPVGYASPPRNIRPWPRMAIPPMKGPTHRRQPAGSGGHPPVGPM